jgi:uncharacterized protein (DUF362 family)
MESMDKARVVIVRSRAGPTTSVDIDAATIRRMFEVGVRLLTGENDPYEGLRRFFRFEDRVGIKINTIGGKNISTRPGVSLTLALWLGEKNVRPGNIVIWDRTNRELRDAGYRLSEDKNGPRIFGTDTDGAGYGSELVAGRNVGSLFSTIQENSVTASISLAILKDHGLAGVTAGMKNYFGAIHNPNKYHDSRCDPYVAEVFDTPSIRGKHRLTILDCLTVQCHKGPSFHPQWAEKYGALVLGADPVAADAVGWRIIEEIRAKKGLPSLAYEHREPLYLATAERMGLGTADPGKIEVIEENI